MSTQHRNVVADVLDIIFEQRNKAYGAYQLRRKYPAYLARALGMGLFLVVSGLAIPLILSAVSRAFPAHELRNVEIVMGAPPDVEKPVVPPPVPPTPPPPAKPMEQFVPPVVKKDNLVQEEPPHTTEELELTQKEIGKTDIQGDPDAPPSTDPDPAEFGPILEHQPVVDDKVYEFVDVNKMPSFPGGEREMLVYLAKNIKYPPLARENNIQGTVALSFVVEKDGSISHISVLRDIAGGCTKEAIRVLESMPRWTPGEANGQPVKVRFVIPIRFQLQ